MVREMRVLGGWIDLECGLVTSVIKNVLRDGDDGGVVDILTDGQVIGLGI